MSETPQAPDLKPTNPKDLIGSDKLPFHLWPETATALGALALLEGASKYGRANWRVAGVRASIYLDAARRHLAAWFEGENADPDSGVDHLGHVLACIAIVVDARAAGKLTDDRQVVGGYRALLTGLSAQVPTIKAAHAHRSPKHYTILDIPVVASEAAPLGSVTLGVDLARPGAEKTMTVQQIARDVGATKAAILSHLAIADARELDSRMKRAVERDHLLETFPEYAHFVREWYSNRCPRLDGGTVDFCSCGGDGCSLNVRVTQALRTYHESLPLTNPEE